MKWLDIAAGFKVGFESTPWSSHSPWDQKLPREYFLGKVILMTIIAEGLKEKKPKTQQD